MAEPVKFNFETVFELKDGGGSGRGVAFSQSYTRQELNAACEEARQAGFAEGVAQEQARIERRQADALDAIGERMSEIARVQAAEFERTVKSATALSLAVARKVAPALMQRQPLAEIEAMIADHLAQLIDEPNLVMRVPDALLDAIKNRIDEIAEDCGYAGRIVLLADSSLGESDCHIEWADGGAERNTDAVWREIETAIERLLHAPVGDSPEDDGVTAPDAGNPIQAPVESEASHDVDDSETDQSNE